MNQKLISFDLRADFGFFKKPDVNDDLVMGYNMLHRPALLGLLGAIVGLAGHKTRGELPEYYGKLASLRIGIAPLNIDKEPHRHNKGNFQKTAIIYTNTVGYANKDEFGKGATQIIEEQTLLKPAYRVFLLLDLDDLIQSELCKRICTGEAEYLPYFGKNEHAVWWETEGENGVREYDFCKPFDTSKESFRIDSIFVKSEVLKDREANSEGFFSMENMFSPESFLYFERLPIDFDRIRNEKPSARKKAKIVQATFDFEEAETNFKWEYQYRLADFAFTNWLLLPNSVVSNSLFEIGCGGHTSIVQFF